MAREVDDAKIISRLREFPRTLVADVRAGIPGPSVGPALQSPAGAEPEAGRGRPITQPAPPQKAQEQTA